MYSQRFATEPRNVIKTFVPTTSHQSKEKQRYSIDLYSSKGKTQDSERHDQRNTLLPVFALRKSLLQAVDKFGSVIMIGETGCGKTTQLPQLLLKAKMNGQGMIAVSQPCSTTTKSVAQYVAQQMGSTVGSLVGYKVPFEDMTSQGTCIKYLTDDMLLHEAVLDQQLLSYNIIVLDETHQRTVCTDILFGVVKQARAERLQNNLEPLKVILVSLLMDVDHLRHYFGDMHVVFLTDCLFPIRIFHCKQPQEDYRLGVLVTIFQIHRTAPPNHYIRVFLSGQEEIIDMAAEIRAIAKELPSIPVKVQPLFSSRPNILQMVTMRQMSPTTRLIILSTDEVGTSFRIPGVKYVIDSGVANCRRYEVGTGLNTLTVENISQMQAWHRTSCVDRESEGRCYRVYTIEAYEKMPKTSVPEIQRGNLSSGILQLAALGKHALSFDFLDKPPRESVINTLEQLHRLGVMSTVEEAGLTELGEKMAQFPLDPRFSRMLFSSQTYGCVEEMLSVAALLSVESILINPLLRLEDSKAAHRKFYSPEGDLITLLNMYHTFISTPVTKHGEWCCKNFLKLQNLEQVVKARAGLAALCNLCGVVGSMYESDMTQRGKCLITGLCNNVAQLTTQDEYITMDSRQVVKIHPLSCLFGQRPPLVLYTELIRLEHCYMQHVTPIQPEWLSEVFPMANQPGQFSSMPGTTP